VRCGIDEQLATQVANLFSWNGAMRHDNKAMTWDQMKAERLDLNDMFLNGSITNLDVRENPFSNGQGGEALCAALNVRAWFD
jgi:hypothetical protein